MSPTFLTAAFLGHILPTKNPSDEPQAGLEPDQGLGDPEKGASSCPGISQDQTEHQDGDDTDQENEDLELAHGAENERRSSRGLPLTFTGTMSSSSMNTFSRPSLPNWLVRTREVLFGSPRDREESVSTYRRAVIISGNLIPFSILLEIPGLTENWYVRTSGYQIVESRKNPPWLMVLLSISLALAVLANIALVSRFLERRVKRSTIICITALTVHGNLLPSYPSNQVELVASSDILNITTVVTWTTQHPSHDGFTNSGAFWMTTCSTIVSTITNVILIWDLVKTPNFDKAGMSLPVQYLEFCVHPLQAAVSRTSNDLSPLLPSSFWLTSQSAH
jgi:potassium channel subfamily K, other eukaryote